MVLPKSFRRLMAAGLLTAGAGLVAVQPAQGRVLVRFGPPPPRVEHIVPGPHPGWAWVGGHWRWDGSRWIWAPGYWAPPPRMDAVWVPGHWVHRPRGWVWIEGHWA